MIKESMYATVYARKEKVKRSYASMSSATAGKHQGSSLQIDMNR